MVETLIPYCRLFCLPKCNFDFARNRVKTKSWLPKCNFDFARNNTASCISYMKKRKKKKEKKKKKKEIVNFYKWNQKNEITSLVAHTCLEIFPLSIQISHSSQYEIRDQRFFFFFFFPLTQNFTFILIRVSHLYLVRFMHTRIIEIVKSRVRSRTKKINTLPHWIMILKLF